MSAIGDAVPAAEPEYVIVQPGLDGVAWLGEVIDGELAPIGKVQDLFACEAILQAAREFHAGWGDVEADDLDVAALWEDLDRILNPAASTCTVCLGRPGVCEAC